MPASTKTCRPRTLTPEQLERATRRALEVNPANAAERHEVVRTPIGRRGGPRRLAVVIGNKWPVTGVRLSVQFLDTPPRALRTRILRHMNAWNHSANVHFVETQGVGEVRIARLDRPDEVAGYWSFLGTEILGIEPDQPTMNLEGFTMRTSDAEFRRVVRHEAGHTLGFDHEHMRESLVARIDRRKAIAFYDRTQGWTPEETLEQVLTPLARHSIMGTTEADPTSIMCYHVPAAITKNGRAIRGGTDINARDYAFAATIYPKTAEQAVVPPATARAATAPAAAASTPPASPALPDVPASHRSMDADAEVLHLVVMDAFDGARGDAASAGSGPRFARIFASYGGARVTEPLRLRAARGEAPTHWGDIIRLHTRLQQYTEREKGTLPTDAELVDFGRYLFDTLFQGDVRTLYNEARARQRNRPLDLVFTSMIPWIAEKPWEFAFDRTRRSFLATEEVHFVRNVLTAVPADVVPPRAGPLRMLIASAQPVAFDRLSVEEEIKVIERGFEPLVEAGLVTIETLARVSPGALHARLATGDFQIVHVIGHGGFDEAKQEGYLIFESTRGGHVRVSERSAREILCQRGVQMVFLNACQSGTGGRADFNKGVAQSLVAHGLPALVANQYSVLDASATSFAQHFYWSLAQGLSLGQAAREARIAVNYSMHGESIDWAVPVVYARDPGLVLATPASRFVPFPAGPGRTERRSATGKRTVRVALWDLDSAFPLLEQTIAQLNAAQSYFGFEVAAMSAPLDVWDLDEPAPDGGPYLSASRLADRVARRAAELRVDLLFCLSRHWMRDEGRSTIAGAWSPSNANPVVVFSCAGFDGLAASGPATDRALANLLAMGLVSRLGDLETHARGPKSCVLFRNVARSTAVITARQHLEPRCRALLQEKRPAVLAPIEAILTHFG